MKAAIKAPRPIVNRREMTVTAPEGWAFDNGTLHQRVCFDLSDLAETVSEYYEQAEPCTDAGCDWCGHA